MTTDTEVKYEERTAHAMRGMESRTIKKWQDDAWEVVSQTHGKLQTEITFRRPKPKSRRLLWIIGGAALALILGTVITIGVIGERNAPAGTAEPATSSTQEAPEEEPAPEPTQAEPTPTTAPAPAVLTPENSPEFASILALGDYCSPDIAAFATAHSGDTIAFPGYIGAINPHDRATTRYDILIGAGEYSETSAPGPAFQFRDVNTTNDMRWVGDVPDSVGVGTNLAVTAEVDRYEESSCLFVIEPVSTAVR
ncbi:DUF4839 domain-containing protein [Microbacterium sp. F51-2R]|uniref:DUF4839 domain-containing protein n=1 Tax=Microbacterium sp. F51-2R TaxID=3445777 RepID=UPI003FA12BCD